MAEVFPFTALLFNPEKVGRLENVVTQPYDKITEVMRNRYYSLSEYSLARIIRGESLPTDNDRENVYSRAKDCFEDWRKRGVLLPSSGPGLYPYFQEYEVPGTAGIRRVRKGFIGLGKLEDYSSGIVFPHEETLTAPKVDRLNLLRTTRAHFGQIFMLYSDPDRMIDTLLDEASQTAPIMRMQDEYGVLHSVWKIDTPEMIQTIQQRMSGKQLIIADGHHRYETALNFRNECRSGEHKSPSGLARYEKALMTFVNLASEGLTILPTHRLVHNLSRFDLKSFLPKVQMYFNLAGFKFFTPEEKKQKFKEMLHELNEVGQVIHTIGMRAAGTSNFYLLKLKGTLDLSNLLPGISERQRQVDAVILHELLLGRCLGISEDEIRSEIHIKYVREPDVALEAVDEQEAQLCFFLNPTPISQVQEIALSGERLPQKSTDFYPKLLSGLTIYWLDLP